MEVTTENMTSGNNVLKSMLEVYRYGNFGSNR